MAVIYRMAGAADPGPVRLRMDDQGPGALQNQGGDKANLFGPLREPRGADC